MELTQRDKDIIDIVLEEVFAIDGYLVQQHEVHLTPKQRLATKIKIKQQLKEIHEFEFNDAELKIPTKEGIILQLANQIIEQQNKIYKIKDYEKNIFNFNVYLNSNYRNITG